MTKPRISIAVAVGRDRQHNRVVGKTGELLWHIPDDLKRFKQLTLGHPVIMGRKTFESILAMLGKPLPGRTNIVVTRDSNFLSRLNLDIAAAAEVAAAGSLEEALAKARELDNEEIFIGGGSQIYEQALIYADRLYLTLIDDEKDGDAFFPPYEDIFTKKISEESRDWNGLKYSWATLEK